jgi:acyl transferase domain-containing protein
MGASLLEYSEFKTSLKAQDTILAKLPFSPPWNLEDIISGCSKSSVMHPGISQTACTALQIALVDLLQSWNITPEFTLGHSSGEIAAAYAGGYISLAEAITIAYCRGKAIENNYEEGLMLAVGKSQDELVPLLEGIESQIKIAAINSPGSCTLSGNASSIKDLHKRLLADGAFVRLLQTGGNAYHSHHMTPVGLEYQNILETALYRLESLGELTCSKRQPSVRMISSVMPTKQLVAKSMGPSYWRQNLESPVLFSEALEVLLAHQEETVGILIEVGPHSALQSPIKQVIAKSELSHGIKAPTYMSVLKRNEDSMSNILNLCGQLFCLEYPVNLGLTNSAEVVEQHTTNFVQGSVCVDLPTYRYNYGVPIYYENRISREIKQRRYLRHDILGVLQAGCAKERPAWRNILRMKDVPWLKDHQVC